MKDEATVLTPECFSELQAKLPGYQRDDEVHLANREINRMRAALRAPVVDEGTGRVAMTFRTSEALKAEFEQVARILGMPLSTATRRAMIRLISGGYEGLSEGEEGAELAMTIRVSSELKAAFEKLAKKQGISISAAMRWAMRGFIQENQ